MRPKPPNVLLLAITVAMSLAASELGVRALVPMEQVSLVHDPILGLRGRPNLTTIWTREVDGDPIIVRTNQFGFHDLAREETKSANTFRAMFIGDSFLEAYQVPIEKNFCRMLETTLSPDSAEELEFVNAGVHTYGLGSYYLFVKERLPDWNPDAVVVVVFLGNDVLDNYAATASSAVPSFTAVGDILTLHPSPQAGGRVWLRDHVLAKSALVRFVWLRIVQSNQRLADAARHAGLVGSSTNAASSDDIGGAIEVAKLLLLALRNALPESMPLVLYLIPDPVRVNQLARQPNPLLPLAEERARRIESELTPFLEVQGFEYVYPLESFVEAVRLGSEVYVGGSGHLTVLGHELSAFLLQPHLQEMIERGTPHSEARRP
jgi:hypothetical protein